MKPGSMYFSKYATIVWDNPGELLLCENEKSVISILNKNQVFYVINSYDTKIEVQKFSNHRYEFVTRSVAKIITSAGVNGWLVSYNDWKDFDYLGQDEF